ncbi:MAG: transposase [Enterocloster sp.]
MWNEFWNWLETLKPTGGSKLEKAVNYAFNHKETLMNYLLDGRCEISNNAEERRAKSYVTGRKNFLFHDTVNGSNGKCDRIKYHRNSKGEWPEHLPISVHSAAVYAGLQG